MTLPLLLVLPFLQLVPSTSAQDPHSFVPTSASWSNSVGVTYNLSLPGLPTPSVVAQALVHHSIPRVRLVNPDPEAISAFSKTDIDVFVSIDDLDLLLSFATDNSSAPRYLSSHVVPALPSIKLSMISVGEGVLVYHRNLSDLVLPAVSNMYNACQALGLTNVTVNSVHSWLLITKPFPPSQAEADNATAGHLQKLLDFYSSTGAPFAVDLFPYAVYTSASLKGLNLEFATFKATSDDQKLQDLITLVMYDNLFEVMVDAMVAVISRFGYPMMPVVVAATGWPALDGVPGGGAAKDYNQGLIDRVNTITGTPLRIMVAPSAYVKGLFDVGYEVGPYDGSFAMWNREMVERYPLQFKSSAAGGDMVSMVVWWVLVALAAAPWTL